MQYILGFCTHRVLLQGSKTSWVHIARQTVLPLWFQKYLGTERQTSIFLQTLFLLTDSEAFLINRRRKLNFPICINTTGFYQVLQVALLSEYFFSHFSHNFVVFGFFFQDYLFGKLCEVEIQSFSTQVSNRCTSLFLSSSLYLCDIFKVKQELVEICILWSIENQFHISHLLIELELIKILLHDHFLFFFSSWTGILPVK